MVPKIEPRFQAIYSFTIEILTDSTIIKNYRHYLRSTWFTPPLVPLNKNKTWRNTYNTIFKIMRRYWGWHSIHSKQILSHRWSNEATCCSCEPMCQWAIGLVWPTWPLTCVTLTNVTFELGYMTFVLWMRPEIMFYFACDLDFWGQPQGDPGPRSHQISRLYMQ